MRPFLFALAFALLCVSAIAAGPVREAESLSTLLAQKGFGEEWVRGFDVEWRAMSARGELPSRTVQYVVGLLRREWIPEDPVSAAEEIYRTTRDVELKRQSGEPLWKVGARLRREMDQSRAGSGEARLSRGAPGGLEALRSWRADRERDSRRRSPGAPGGGGASGDGTGRPAP